MGLYDDLQQEKIFNAQASCFAAASSGVTPEQARQDYNEAARMGITPAMLRSMSHDERARATVDTAYDWDTMRKNAGRSAFLQSLGNPEFVNVVRDDTRSMGLIEKAAWWLGGQFGQDATGSYWQAARNSAARGMLGGFNTLPFFGNAEKSTELSRKRRELQDMKKRLDAGEDPRSVFKMQDKSQYTDDYVKNNLKLFNEDYEHDLASYDAQIADISERLAHFKRAEAVYPQGAEMAAFNNAEGFVDTMKQAFASGNFLSLLANTGPESAVQFLPSMAVMLGATAATGGLGAGAAVTNGARMAVQAISSYRMDKQASLLDRMSKAGVNVYDAQAIAEYLKNGKSFDADVLAARRHAAGTALFDAASIGAAGIRIGRRVPKVSELLGAQPEGASIMQRAASNAYLNAGANFLLQGQIQGALGAAGEASGQYLSEGRITSWSGIIAEYAGEHFTAPLEMFSAGIGARKAAAIDLKNALRARETVHALADAAQNSKAIQESPGAVGGFLQLVEEKNPEAAQWKLDTSGFTQEEKSAFVASVRPEIRAAVKDAVQMHEPLTLSLKDFTTGILASREAADLVVRHDAATPIGRDFVVQTEAEAVHTQNEMEKQSTNDAIAQSAPPDFKHSLANVGKQIEQQLNAAGIIGAERDSNTTLLMTHVANMARETGMTPEEVWSLVGIKEVIDGSKGKDKEGNPTDAETPKNSKGTKILGMYAPSLRQITVWGKDRNKSTFLHEGAHWFMDGRVKLAVELMKRGASTAEQQRFLDVTERAVKWASGKDLETFSRMSAEEQRDAQEKFARTYEEYLKTGQAPTVALTKIFARFSAWLKSIYGALVHTPGAAKMGKETLELFDDLFTAGEAVQEAMLRRQLLLDGGKLVTDANGNITAGGPTETSIVAESLTKADRDEEGNIKDEAVERLIQLRQRQGDKFALLAASTLRKLMQKANAIRRDIRKEVKAELTDRREQKIYDFFHKRFEADDGGKWSPRLDAAELKKLGVPDDQIAKLIELKIASKRPGKKSRIAVGDVADVATKEGEKQTERENADGVALKEPEARTRTVAFAEVAAAFQCHSAVELAAKFKDFQPMNSDMINAETDKVMAERFPELSTAEDVTRTADAAIFTPTAAKAVAMEIAMLDKTVGKDQSLIGMFRLLAEGILANTPMEKLNPRKWRLLASEEAKKAQMAREAKGDPSIGRTREEEIVEHKRKELKYMQMAAVAEEILMRQADNNKRWRKLYQGKDSVKGMEASFVEQMQFLLSKLDIIDKTVDTKVISEGSGDQRIRIRKRRSWADFMEEAKLRGWSVPEGLSESLLRLLNADPIAEDGVLEADKLKEKEEKEAKEKKEKEKEKPEAQEAKPEEKKGEEKKPEAKPADDAKKEPEFWKVPGKPLVALQFNKLTTRQLDELDAFMHDMEAAARKAVTVTIDGKKKNVDDLMDILTNEILENKKTSVKDMETTTGDDMTGKLRHMWRAFSAVHIRIPAFIAGISGSREGIAFRIISSLIDKPAGEEAKLKAQYSRKLVRAFAPLMDSLKDHEPRFYAGLNSTMTKSQIIICALNMGNEENKARLLDGSDKYTFNTTGDKWTEAELTKAIESTLSEKELLAIQKVWDLFGPLRDKGFAIERRAGRIAQEVPLPADGVTFTIGGKPVKLKGGYYPVAYDRYLGVKSEQLDIEEHALTTLCAVKGKGSTDNGHMKTRAASTTGEAVSLTFRAAADGMNAIIHDVCWREPLQDMNKIFNPRGKVMAAIRDRWGVEKSQAVTQWIEDMAMNGRRKQDMGDVLLSALRQGLSVAMLGFSPITALAQISGITQSVSLIGGKWVLAGLNTLFSQGADFRKNKLKMMAKSRVLRDRGITQLKEMAEAQRILNGSRLLDWKDKMVRASYLVLGATQLYCVDFPTWQGAYEKALSEGMSDKEAILRADRDLLDAQGSSRLTELSGLERSSEGMKLFTVMYGFFNTTLNLAMMTRYASKDSDRGQMIWKLFLILGVQSVLDSLLRNAAAGAAGGGDDIWSEKFLKKVLADDLKFNLGMLIGIRELSGAVDPFFGQKSYGYRGPAGVKAINDAYRFMELTGKGKWDHNFAKAGISVLGDSFGIPSTQINRMIDAYYSPKQKSNPFAYAFGVPK